ncbi:rhodanese-like domain-containing protein [Aestuariicoccus sp. MJ-SS9]|uniref:rhodanese-like domain-containing protein n=1 Tax=Aestuariicoccus sp. MJ-SS9 TaxID=3079855 RepID=UPI0029062D21|nr:rhodanese-like domain-containing protein [Aestuariicoccus sp. MJ-SS9]MDU8914068.1 rhodanese-like domain-containing protein [Aestuariicoccus sp. MJ-SS9]
MMPSLHRRLFLAGVLTSPVVIAATPGLAQGRTVWSAKEAYQALRADTARLIDVRSREEWRETGVGAGIWPISMHEDRFAERLFAARDLAGDRTVGLICATGGRSAALLGALRKAGYANFADISEGMLGSRRGPGWLATGLPVVPMETALASLPDDLA